MYPGVGDEIVSMYMGIRESKEMLTKKNDPRSKPGTVYSLMSLSVLVVCLHRFQLDVRRAASVTLSSCAYASTTVAHAFGGPGR